MERIECLWRKEVKVDGKKGFKMTKKAENMKGWTSCKLQEGSKLDLLEYVQLAFKYSVDSNKGKFALKDLPVWKDIENFCLASMFDCIEEFGGHAKLFWDIQASRTGKTWYLVARDASFIPVKFTAKEEKVETSEKETAEEVPATSDADLLRALAHQVQNADLASILERLASIGVEGWKSETPKEVAIA